MSHRPKIDFIYAQHNPSNHARIIDALKASDGQILAVEAVGESQDERRAVERVVNRVFDPASELHAPDIEQLLEYGDGFIDYIVTAFEDSGKTFSLIDISSEHRITQLVGHTYRLHKTLLEKMWSGVSNAELRAPMRNILKLDAHAVTVRERTVFTQLTTLMSRYPEQHITVFEGADHTRVSHALGRVASVSRVFVPAIEHVTDATAGVTMRYPAYDLLLRQLLFDKPVSDAQIDEYLEYYVDRLTS